MGAIALLGFCLLAALAAFALQFLLPIFLLYQLVKAVSRYMRTGKPPWRPDEPQRRPGDPATLKEALDRAKETAARAAAAVRPAGKAAGPSAGAEAIGRAARIEEEVRLAEALLKRKRDELSSALKEQGRVDRLALVYYVEASLREGCAASAVKAALKAKGWQDADIAAAFQACGVSAAAA